MKLNPTLLVTAAQRFNERTDAFSQKKKQVCLDLARTLERLGIFVSAKQEQYALDLVRQARVVIDKPEPPTLFPCVVKHVLRKGIARMSGLRLYLTGSAVIRVISADAGIQVCGQIDIFGRFEPATDCPDHIFSRLQAIEINLAKRTKAKKRAAPPHSSFKPSLDAAVDIATDQERKPRSKVIGLHPSFSLF